MISRKAQVRMMETVMILVIFFIIVVLGFMFYSRMQESTMKELRRERFEEEAIAISQNILYLPELACTEKNVMVDICFDIHKLEAFSEIVVPENRQAFLFYQKDLGESRITVKKIFPPGQEDKWVIYDNPPVNAEEISSINTSIPVSLKNPVKRYNQYSVGVLTVEVFG